MLENLKIIFCAALLGLAAQEALAQEADAAADAAAEKAAEIAAAAGAIAAASAALNETFDSDTCVALTKEACIAVARNRSMELGGMAGTDCTWPFEGSVDDGYAPGCYGYSSGSCDNIAFFGNGGTQESIGEAINEADTEWGTRARLYDDACGWHDYASSYGCSWKLPNGEPLVVAANNTMMCNNGVTCEGDDSDHSSATWGCCNDNGGRAMCPQNYPEMCITSQGLPGCQDGTAYCCEKDCSAIGQEARSCGCTWVTPSGLPITSSTDNMLVCNDGSTCMGDDNDHEDGNWDCCDGRGGRAMCPPNWPYMCADPKGSPAGTDYSCWDDCELRGKGGNRQCW